MSERPLLLVTNDDGIRAAGLRALERSLARLGEVWTVAPDAERSATSHSLNLRRPLLVTPAGRRRFAVAGTPVDSVFVGLFGLLPRRPAVVISGINYGPNLGTDTIYSGTVAAAREAALRGIPGVAVSLTEGRDYSAPARVAARLVATVLDAGPAARREGRGVLLNLNVPPRPKPGVRLTCLGRRVYPEDVAVRRGRNGRMHARIGGYPVRGDGALGTDTRAIDDGYASLSVLTLDFTQHDARRRFRALLAVLDGTRGAAKEVRR